jgi:hypothetical protein
MQKKAMQANDTAETHGDPRSQDETLYQFHSTPELERGLLGLYGQSKIKEARKVLLDKGVITEHRNPNPKYHFDKTIHYLFHPEPINAFLTDRVNASVRNKVSTQPDQSEITDASVRSTQRSVKNNRAIPETTSEIGTPPSPSSSIEFFQNSIPEEGTPPKGESAPQTAKKKKEWDIPEWFAPMADLPGYKTVDHSRAAGAIAATCDEVGIDKAAFILHWCKEYKINRHTYRWLDPVAACKGRPLSIALQNFGRTPPHSARPPLPGNNYGYTPQQDEDAKRDERKRHLREYQKKFGKSPWEAAKT